VRTNVSRILLLALTAGLAACSSQKTSLVKPAGESQQPAAAPKRQSQIPPLRRKVVSLLEKKNYRQAIELMNGKNREGLEKEYVQALNGLLEAGNDAFSSGDYGAAGRSFKMALNAYPAEPPLRDRVSHEPKQIRALLDACVNRLMEQGLEEYRRGNLESAIGKWKALLAIRPGHKEAKKALDTATVQLQALQNMKDR
jgi:outer membrane protein assembly factor BamD (BamD/ComL family)